MLEQLKEKVFIANQDMLENTVCLFPWVSVSAIDREHGLVVMMPDGGAVTEEDMAVVDLTGKVVEGKEPPVCDTAVHLKLYEAFPEIGAIAHPYSRWATVFAQLDLGVPVFGTIHAASFGGHIPSTERLPEEALTNPGDVRIAAAVEESFRQLGRSPLECPAVLVNCHGAYTFGEDARNAVGNAMILDEVTFLAYHTMQLDPGIRPMQCFRKGKRNGF